MSKNYFIKGTNIEVSVGDNITLGKLTQKDLEALCASGMLEERTPINLLDVINSLAKKVEMTDVETFAWIQRLTNANPSAVLSILLKEISNLLESKYSDDAEDCETVFCISKTDGSIFEIRTDILNLKTFAFFRTVEDALLALSITKDVYARVFDLEDEQED